MSTATALLNESCGSTATIRIPRIDLDLPLADLYDRVEFPPTETLR